VRTVCPTFAPVERPKINEQLHGLSKSKIKTRLQRLKITPHGKDNYNNEIDKLLKRIERAFDRYENPQDSISRLF